MAKTDNPEVSRFEAKDKFGDEATITLGPLVAYISTTKWPRDENGEAIDMGNAQTICIDRATLIGLAYEILQTVKD